MSILNILIWPDERLKIVAEPITEVTSDIQELGRDLIETMYAAQGIGLAATQVDRHQRIIAIDLNGGEPKDRNPSLGPYIMINPEITDREGTIVYEEGCLSIPGETAEVERSAWIAGFTGPDGTQYSLEADGLRRCVQHEIDHLNGIVFPDRLSPERARIRRHATVQVRGSNTTATDPIALRHFRRRITIMRSMFKHWSPNP